MPPIRAQNDLRRAADFGDLAACFADTGGLRVPLVYEARPLALSPPLGFFPSLRVHAAVFAILVPYLCSQQSPVVIALLLLVVLGVPLLGRSRCSAPPLLLLHLFVT